MREENSAFLPSPLGRWLSSGRRKLKTTSKLSKMQGTGTSSAAFVPVPQTGEYADQLRKNLEQIKLPPGFKIDLYADRPRRAADGGRPAGVVTFVGTRKEAIWAVTDRNKDGTADEVKRFAPIARIAASRMAFASRRTGSSTSPSRTACAIPGGGILLRGPGRRGGRRRQGGRADPGRRESSITLRASARRTGQEALHPARAAVQCAAARARPSRSRKIGIGGIVRMDQDGKNREIYATGMRNPGGNRFQPRTGELWSNDNQVDGMGDDIPPGEINRIARLGEEFGFPWYGGGHVRTNEFKNDEPPADVVFPVVETIAHAADLGIVFYTGNKFPEKYKQGVSRPSTARGTAPCRPARGCCSPRSTTTAPPDRRRTSLPAG